MSRKLDDLSDRFKPKAIELIARCAEAGIPILIINTLRTESDQLANIAKGVSWTRNSRHLAQPWSNKAEAIDVAPYETWQAYGPDKINWDASDPVWVTIGEIGEKLGLRWGGRWTQRDMGHFEYLRESMIEGAAV
jgi:hypothetical protein